MEPAEHDAAAGREMTLDEWFALDEERGGELVDGRIEEQEASDFVHDLCAAWVGRVLAPAYLPGARFPPRRGLVRVPPGCEGLVLDLDALWAEVDRLPAE